MAKKETVTRVMWADALDGVDRKEVKRTLRNPGTRIRYCREFGDVYCGTRDRYATIGYIDVARVLPGFEERNFPFVRLPYEEAKELMPVLADLVEVRYGVRIGIEYE